MKRRDFLKLLGVAIAAPTSMLGEAKPPTEWGEYTLDTTIRGPGYISPRDFSLEPLRNISQEDDAVLMGYEEALTINRTHPPK